MAAIRMSTAGIKVYYAFESESGVRPTESFQQVPEVTEIPEMSNAPDSYDATPLEETKVRLYVPGLMDLGGSMALTANMSPSELKLWNTDIVGGYETNIKEDKKTWMCIVIPGFDVCYMFPFQPTKIGMPGASVGEVFQVQLPYVQTDTPDWYDVPTELKPLGV